jgi:hypothetical protein
MTYEPKEHPVVARFRAHHAELEALHPQVRLYALIDFSPMDDWLRRRTIKTLAPAITYPLYGDTGLDSLAETGPFLIPCPDFVGAEPLALHRSLIGLAMKDHRYVSWVWTVHDVEPFIEHLQSLLHARLAPDDEDAWFFFHQPAYLPVLHRELPVKTKDYMFGPCISWWCLDVGGDLMELDGGNLPLPTAWDALPVPEEVVNALHREGAAAQTRAWLKSAMPDLLVQQSANAELVQLVPLVNKAFGYGITDKVNLGVYSAFALRYGTEYDDHPALQDLLTRFRDTKLGLIDAYAALGDTVWREIQDTAKQRAEEAAALAYQAECQKRGYATVRVKLVNDLDSPIRKIEIHPPKSSYMGVTSLGDVRAAFHSAVTVELGMLKVPVPGTTVTVKWTSPIGYEFEREAVVTGELPRGDGMGVATVKLARNHYGYISMLAEEPKPKTFWEEQLEHSRRQIAAMKPV